ncbi:MAG: hypothetical protein Q7R56_01785 [Nanoarchaeota archaeon]|nr:hypothetical protein [Nanoarchaeota archaeon]
MRQPNNHNVNIIKSNLKYLLDKGTDTFEAYHVQRINYDGLDIIKAFKELATEHPNLPNPFI